MMKRMWTPMKRALSSVILFNGDAQEALNVAQMQIKKAMGPEADQLLKKGQSQ